MSYTFVPIPERPRTSEHVEKNRHDQRLRGAIFGRLTLHYALAQPVHVGSGFKRVEGRTPVRGMTRSGDRFVIPGSSMKGAMRARFEAMTHSCALYPVTRRDGVRTQSRSQPNITRARIDRAAMDHALQRNCRKRDRACPACALFGLMSSRSRVSFDDFAPTDPTAAGTDQLPAQYGPRIHHVGKSRVDQSAGVFVVTGWNGRKFYRGRGPETPARMDVDVLPAGTVVVGRVSLFNVQPAELGGLFSATGFHPGSLFKVGAGKGEGFGQLRPSKIEFDLKGWNRAPIDQDVGGWRQAWLDGKDRFGPGEEALVRYHGGQL